MTLLSPELFRVHVLSAIAIVGPERDILRDIRRSLRDDKQEEPVAKAAHKLQRDRGRGMVRSAEWSESEGLMLFRGKVYVPEDRELCRRIVEQHHDTHIAGHPGRFKTLKLVARNYWWPRMSRYIGQYVITSDLSCRTKLQHRQPTGELHPSETPNKPWDTISVAFIVELPCSNGYDAIMNVVDGVTKRTHFFQITPTTTPVGRAPPS